MQNHKLQEEVASFIKNTFELRDRVHLYHWFTNNANEHEFLGEYYDGLITSIDNFFETFYGNIINSLNEDIIINTVLSSSKLEKINNNNTITLNSILDLLDEYKFNIQKLIYIFSNENINNSFFGEIDLLTSMLEDVTKMIYKMTKLK